MTRRLRLVLAGLMILVVGLLLWSFQPVRVIGKSMEPSLVEGDWLVLGGGEPEMEDLVVFREPGSGKLAVKRVAGVPGGRVQLSAGDLLLDGEVYHRELEGVEDLVPLIDGVGEELGEALSLERSGFTTVATALELGPGEVGLSYLRTPPREGYLLRGTTVSGELPAADLGVEVQYRLLGPGAEVELLLRKGRSQFTARIAGGGGRLVILRENGAEPEELLASHELPPGAESGRMFFTLADRAINVIVNGEPVVEDLAYEAPEPHTLSEVPAEFGRLEHAGIGGRGPLEIGRVRVGRDVLYDTTGTYGVGSEFQLGDDQYYLLGDNPAQSRDSRHYGAVGRDRILGVVSWRAWPGGWTERGWPRD